MKKRQGTLPRKDMNPALAAMSQEQRNTTLINATQKCNMILTLMVLHDKFGFGGKGRLPRFIEEYEKLLKAYNDGYINVQDIEGVLKKECGIEVRL